MKPIDFRESNTKIAENQDEYVTLPAHKVNEKEGRVIFCMSLNLWERIRILFTGKIWCTIMTFNQPLQPSHFTTNKSEYFINLNKKWLFWVNLLLFQFLFVRLTVHFEEKSKEIKAWSIQGFILPFTGWGNIDFKYITKRPLYFYLKKY